MNWYKNAQEFENPPEWNYPGAEHDYNPNWDYEVDDNPEEDAKKYIEEYVQRIKSEIIDATGFIADIKIGYVRNLGALAKYINGTSTHMVIVIDIEGIRQGAQKYMVDFLEQLDITVVHEIAHGIQEGMNLAGDEAEAERFADIFCRSGVIWRFWDE